LEEYLPVSLRRKRGKYISKKNAEIGRIKGEKQR
jgi:hypothetical protein